MKQFIKALIQDMLKPIDGKKTNWWINGFVLFTLITIVIGVIASG